jgi:DNA-binding MarR family transcriptional regulator
MRSTASPVIDRIGYLVKQLQHVLRARMDDKLAAIGLSTAQYALLAAIEEAPGLSGAELARRCFITPQSVNGLIGALERDHLIERSASASHGRIIEISLTASGKSRLKEAHRAVAAIEQRMLRRLGKQEREQLAGTIRHCIEDIMT